MERIFRSTTTRTFSKSGLEIIKGKDYKLDDLQGNLGNSTILKHFREVYKDQPTKVITITRVKGKKGKIITLKKVEKLIN